MLRSPLPRANRPLFRVRGRTLSVYADTSTINIQNSLKFHVVCAASKVLQNYNDLGLKKLFKFLYEVSVGAGTEPRRVFTPLLQFSWLYSSSLSSSLTPWFIYLIIMTILHSFRLNLFLSQHDRYTVLVQNLN